MRDWPPFESWDIADTSPRVTTAVAKQKAHVANATGNNHWYTPPDILDRARRTLGAIDCDPASSAVANERVRAARFYTAEDSGLDPAKPWGARCFLNPPYSKDLIGPFIDALCQRFDKQELTSAIVLVNNASESRWGQKLLEAAALACFPQGRIKFLRPDGTPGNTPLQGRMICLLTQDTATQDRFIEEFAPLGRIVRTIR